ncbi:MAG TPA: LacI family DNA-binding transcriptional regulator [Terriglobales bacterium]|nr:LacI family DNA-binding transcriptional regulator [Terriglobales bacterium]
MTQRSSSSNGEQTITLAELAKRLKLTKGTVSAVLNDSPYARSIPEHTRERIKAAAREFNYQPNFFARTLRKKRTFTIGVIAEEIGDPYGGGIISGIEKCLSEHNYFFLTGIHRHDPKLLQQYLDILLARGIEGLITVDTILTTAPPLPTVAVAGHCELSGVTNILLDHAKAAELALDHLYSLGHREIAVIRGQVFSADSEQRWQSILHYSRKLGPGIRTEAIAQLKTDDPSPQQGYLVAKELLQRNSRFTALFAYNDIASIGAIRAIRESGLRVPEDISVVGFDDIREAAYHLPSLTTVRQPLRRMGAIAAQTIMNRIEGSEDSPAKIAIEPELVVRESSGPANLSRRFLNSATA